MIRTIIVDDETRSRDILKDIIASYCGSVEIVGEARNAAKAKELILEEDPDLVLLDIFMPNGNGFDLLKQMEEINFEVIFITAYDEYAIQAVRSCALDYLLKPVNIAELKAAIDNAEKKVIARTENLQLKTLKENMEQQQVMQQKLAVPDKDGLRFIPMRQIVRLEADGSYTIIFLENSQRILSTRHLKEYEMILPARLFLRVHHSHLINLEHIEQYQRGDGGTVIMSDQSSIQVSKRKKKMFMEIFRF